MITNDIEKKTNLSNILYNENFKLLNDLLIEGLDPNDPIFDTIIFEKYYGENIIINYFDILLEHGYEFKNNIIFYIFCVNLSYSKLNYDYYINFYPESYKKKPTIKIYQSDIDNLISLQIKKLNIIDKLKEQINIKKKKIFPKFIIDNDLIDQDEDSEVLKSLPIISIDTEQMNWTDFIKKIINNEISLNNLDNLDININYLDLTNISWTEFIKKYQLNSNIQIDFYVHLFSQKYELDYDFLIYFLEFGKSFELLDLYICQGLIDYNQIMLMGIFGNYEFFNYVFSIKFKNNNKFSFDANYFGYDKIALKNTFFNYNDLTIKSNIDLEYSCDYDNEQILQDNYPANIKIIKLYNILLNNNYKIKNNIVFYVLCINICSLLLDENIKEEEIKTIKELANNKEFKEYSLKEIITISDIDLEIGKKLLIPRIKLLNIFKYKISYNKTIKMPKFIFHVKF